jgi:predicted aldo/keto reductase-like oxidoreductase
MENMNTEQKLEKVKKMIESLLKDTCDNCGERQSITKQLIIESIIWGSNNYYEGVGILEESKLEYRELIDECFDN